MAKIQNYTTNYAFTIKYIKCNAYATEENLFFTMMEMVVYHKSILSEYVFEYDSMNRLHIHGTMLARKGLFLSRFKRPYWHIHIECLKTVTDVENWTRYIHLDIGPEMKEIAKQIQSEYSFHNPP